MLQDPDLSAQTRIWPVPPAETPPVPRPRLWPIQTALCTLLCIGVLLCKLFSPTAAKTISDLVIGTGESRLRTAVSCFETALDGGGSVGDAISVFCDEIITP